MIKGSFSKARKVFIIMVGCCLFGGSNRMEKALADEQIIPTPQIAEYKTTFLQLGDLKKKEALACIVTSSSPVRETVFEIEQLNNWLKSMNGIALPVLKDSADYSSCKVVIAIGTLLDNHLCKNVIERYKIKLTKEYPGREGYIIKMVKDGERKVVICAGSDHRGTGYALETLKQLISVQQEGVLLREADIEDWPSFKLRILPNGATGGTDWLKWMIKYKLNVGGIHYPQLPAWRNPPTEYKDMVTEACVFAANSGMIDIIQYINPYNPYEGHSEPINLLEPEDIDELVAAFELSLKNGGKAIMLCVDDFFNLTREEKDEFGADAHAQAYLVNQVYKKLREKYPDFELLFCPGRYKYYGVDDEILSFYKILTDSLPEDVGLVWTGQTVRSHTITKEQLLQWEKLVGRKPFYWDNTIYDYHNPFIIENVFDPYLKDNKYPKDFYRFLDKQGIHINSGRSEVYKVAFMTVADYLWNPEKYAPQRSLKHALQKFVGEETGALLIKFGNLYVELMCRNYCSGKKIPYEYIPDASLSISSEELLKELEGTFDNLQQKCQNMLLLGELEKNVERAETLFKENPVEDELATQQQIKQEFADQVMSLQKRYLLELEEIWAKSSFRLEITDPKIKIWKRRPLFKGDLYGPPNFLFPVYVIGIFPYSSRLSGELYRIEWEAPRPENLQTCKLNILVSDDYKGRTTGEYFKQILVNDKVVWEEDIAGSGESEELITVDVREELGEKSVKIGLRIIKTAYRTTRIDFDFRVIASSVWLTE